MLEKETVKKKALDYLLSQSLMVLATASPDGKPYATTMLFTMDDDFNFYFVTRKETRKNRNLIDNPVASISIGFDPPMNVQAEGKVELVEDEKLRGDLFARLAVASDRIDDFWPPILRIEAGEYLLYRIKPSWVRVLDMESRNVNEEEMPLFEIEL